MQNKYPENKIDAGRIKLADHQIGFILSFFFTLFPFALVYVKLLPRGFNIAAICIAAIVQILIQLHYFLGLGGSRKDSWDLIAILFTFLIMTIFIGGTLWVMYTLNYRMM